MNRRALMTLAGGGAMVLLLGGATTSWDLGGEERSSLLVAGSEEFLPYAAALSDAFAGKERLVDVVLEGGGTTPGLIAVKRGAIDLAMASRELNRSEEDKLTRSFLVARDAVALVVNRANPLDGVTKQQATALFDGTAERWRAVGGGSSAIRLYRRKDGSDIQKALDKLVLDGGDMAPDATLVESGAAMVERVAADPDAAGYVTLGDVTPAVKVLAVDGVPMSRITILSGRYPLTRSFYYVLQGEKSPQALSFLAFALSRDGQDVLEKLGLIAVR